MKRDKGTRTHSPYFRPEIEGLRAVAALLVATYHIWFGRVSGGVDVFFVVSGYLVTHSILRQASSDGRVRLGSFWMRLIRRLAPAAFMVLAVILVGSFFLLPKSRWDETGREVLASSLYIENWLLAFNAVDYLAREHAPSPAQHFWALSIQGQFYLLWPLFMISTFAAARALQRDGKRLLLILAAAGCAISFAYSVHMTAINQPWAYFDTGARFWEFGIGALVAITAVRLAIPVAAAALAGWVALAAIISCGFIFQAAASFPGAGALWPTLAALTILLFSQQGERYGVNAFLSSRPMVALGGVAYHLYLWHWPLLIFLLASRDGKSPTDLQGVVIILAAIGLSFLTTRWIETPIRERRIFANRGIITAAAVPILALVPLNFWLTVVVSDEQERLALVVANHPGAALLNDGFKPPVGYDALSVIPSPLTADKDLPKIYLDKCHQGKRVIDLQNCRYGNRDNPTRRIVLVGGSHSAQYFPALEALAAQRGWEVSAFTKSTCRWTADAGPESKSACVEWNEEVTAEIIKIEPDLIITISSVRGKSNVPTGYLEQWRRVTNTGLRVLAIRDNPQFPFNVPECIELHGPMSAKCAIGRSLVLEQHSPEQTLSVKPANVHFVDLSNYFCDDQICPPVIGGVLVYRDTNHLTATYARTLAPMLGEHIEKALNHREIDMTKASQKTSG